MQPRGRYVKLNAVDYILIVALVLLFLTLPIRGILFLRNRADDRTCRANVEFVIRQVDEKTVSSLQETNEPFSVQGGATLPVAKIVKISHTTEYVPDEDGNMQGVESPTSYDVYFSLQAEGARAQDETFLLFGSRRLSVGESLTLTRAGYAYTADFIVVQIS